MPRIHTDAEDVQTLYGCIENELSYVLQLLKQDHVVPLQLELACTALERREHALHAHIDPLRKIQPDLCLIPKKLCDTILKEILQLEQNTTLGKKVDAALQKAAVFFACLERIKGEVVVGSSLDAKVIQQKSARRVESGDNASDHKRRE